MASVTYSEFNANTEGAEVAKAFASEIRGKTIVVTGVNCGGLGFSAAQAFVSNIQRVCQSLWPSMELISSTRLHNLPHIL